MSFLKNYFVNTTAEINFLPITSDIRFAVRDANAKDGLVTVILPGSGASVIVLEPLPEVIDELKIAIEMFAGEGGEANDKRKEKVAVAPRVQSAIFGRSISLPLKDGKLVIDPYEEVYLIDFDTKVRRREYFIQVINDEKPAAAPAAAGKGAPAPRKR